MPVDPQVYFLDPGWLADTVLVRAAGSPAPVAAAARSVFAHATGNDVHVSLLREYVRVTTAPYRTMSIVLSACGAAGILLAILGIVASLTLMVRQQTREIGLRVALGAGAHTIRLEVIGRVFSVAVGGIALGLVVAAGLGRGAASVFYGTPTFNVPIAAMVVAAISLIAFLAAAIPARRAARIDPAIALREF